MTQQKELELELSQQQEALQRCDAHTLMVFQQSQDCLTLMQCAERMVYVVQASSEEKKKEEELYLSNA